MSTMNFAKREISFKIVYYGPAMSGKTTNLRHIYTLLPQKVKGDFTSIATETERTLFFDFLPLELGSIKGFTIRLSLYTVPGQEIYKLTRKSVLRATDGIVFVADSQRIKSSENVASFEDMIENLINFGEDPDSIPIILQYNKRDLYEILTFYEMQQILNRDNKYEYYESIAENGINVVESLKAITKLVVSKV
jgi:signal recognition particle receptor subunit beta